MPNKIKVLHIITRLDTGGSAENTLLTCIGLNKNNYEITLASGAAFSPKNELKKEAENNGVKFVIIPELVYWIAPLKEIISFCKIFMLIKKERFDIVHTHTSKAGILGRLAAKLAGVPIIIHAPHGHIFYGYYNSFLTGIFIIVEKIAAEFTDKIITLTEKGVEEHVKFGIAPENKFIAIHSGIRADKFFSEPVDINNKRNQLGIPQNSLLIGTAGRLVPIKGHKYLMQAMSQINKKLNVILLVIGDGYLRENLEQQAKQSGISNRIKFLGFRNDIAEILSILDIFILPSINEGMGRTLVEAMFLSKPIIATNVGGIPDLVKNDKSGILVPPKDPTAIANAIQQLLENKTLAKEMGKTGREIVKNEFTEKTMVEKIDKLYNDLLKEKQKNTLK